MAIKKVKTAAKIFTSDIDKLEDIIIRTVNKIDSIVGCSLGPGGKNVIIESDMPELPNKNTKDGVTIFRSLGSHDSFEHLLIEQIKDVAIKTVTDAGDGPLPYDTPVLTPNGKKEIGKLDIGEKICGTNGTVQEVTGIYHKGKKQVYEVKFIDGTSTECCEDHLWTVKYKNRKGEVIQETKPVKELIKDFRKKNKNGHYSYKYYIPVTHVEFNQENELPLDPYTLGVLLGDGSLSGTGSIELTIGFKKRFILDKLKLPNKVTYKVTKVKNKNALRVKLSVENGKRNPLFKIMKDLGLLGVKSGTKFIPEIYLKSSYNNRKALLQGLLDTDAYINKRNRFEFSTISEQLAKDLVDLSRSLGIRVSMKEKNREKTGGYSTTKIYLVNEMKNDGIGNKIVDIVPKNEEKEMMCIKVSNPDHLFLVNDYNVTHNTTTSTVLASALIKNLFSFSKKNPKFKPQKTVRKLNKILKDTMLPYVEKRAIKITPKNKHLLEKVATVSASGDKEMANSVIKAFDIVGYGASSHVTIQELSGPSKYEVELIEGLPIDKGFEESIGKFHTTFINDQANQRIVMDKPLFLLFDGKIKDIVQVQDVLEKIGAMYAEQGKEEFKNVIIVAHGFSDSIISALAVNFQNPRTINVLPLRTPMSFIFNSQLHFLMDLAAFTGAKIFDMNNPISQAGLETFDDFGKNMERFEMYRFRSTLIGEPDELNIEARAEELMQLKKQAASKAERQLFEENIGRLTNGIAKLKIYGSSVAELKEASDRCEDAILAVRSAIKHGALPGGGRVLIDLAEELSKKHKNDDIVKEIVIPALYSVVYRLFDNAGYDREETNEIIKKLKKNKDLVYDIQDDRFGTFEELGIFDARMAVEQSLINATSISSMIGTLGGVVSFPRDNELERREFLEDQAFNKTLENADRLAEAENLERV